MGHNIVETCELDLYPVDELKFIHLFNPFHRRLWQWQAIAISPKGRYLSAQSKTFKGPWGHHRPGLVRGGESYIARQEIVQTLLAQGWKPFNDAIIQQVFTREFEEK